MPSNLAKFLVAPAKELSHSNVQFFARRIAAKSLVLCQTLIFGLAVLANAVKHSEPQ